MKSTIALPIITRTTITTVMVGLVVVVGCGFLYSRIAPYMAGPTVVLHDTGTETMTDAGMTFSGKVTHGKQLSINGVPLMIDGDGNFTHRIVMQPGFNTFTLRADDSFGHSTIITKNFVIQEQVYQSFARSEQQQDSVIQ